MMKGLEFIGGLVVGLVFSGIAFRAILGAFEPDPLQEQASQKTYCKTVGEYLASLQEPEERWAFLKKHEKSLTKCKEENHVE